MSKLHELTITEAAARLRDGTTDSVTLTKAVIGRVKSVEREVNGFLHIDEAGALDQAKEADRRLKSGDDADLLLGVPIALKDNICAKGLPTTCASKILGNFISPYDATVTRKLRDSGAVIIGKTNMDEFAMGSSTENSSVKVTGNPWDIGRVPGGSSGGSSAAVSADQAIAALGSDTGGSIRQPAAFCGVVGLKPTYGLVSRYGLVAFASSLDQIGPLTKDVTDAAILLQAIAGRDPADSTSADYTPPDYRESLDGGIDGLRFSVPKELFGSGISAGTRELADDAVKKIESLGGTVTEVSVPSLEYALSAYYIIAPAEASSNLARFDGVRYGRRAPDSQNMLSAYMKTRAEGFGAEVKRRIMLGTYALSSGYYDAYYGQAQKVRTIIIKEFNEAFEQCDLLLSPTTPTPAFEIGAKTDDPLEMYLSDILTIPANLAGLPAISIPVGLDNGLPVGLQLMGKHFDDGLVLRAAKALETEIGFKAKPDIG